MNSRLVTILTSLVFSDFFNEFVDRDLTGVSDHSDTDVVTIARATGADKGNQTVHTHATC